MLIFMMYIWAAAVSILLTPLLIRLARRVNMVDRPGLRKVHTVPTPRLGGVAIALAVLSVALPLTLTNIPLPRMVWQENPLVPALLLGAAAMFLVGLADDIWRIPARLKLLCQIAAACGVCAAGIRIESINLGSLLHVELGWAAWAVTMLWIVGVTNAVNLIDGLDGLAAGIAAVACGAIAVFCLSSGQWAMAALMMTALGALSGFLLFNFHPARIFMGDSGTYFLGFLLAGGSVMSSAKASTIVGLAVPALALGLPIFDTLISIMRRFVQRRSPFAPDRGHIHHRLLKMGLRHHHAVMVMYAVTLTASGMSLVMIVLDTAGTAIVFGTVLLLLVLVFRAAGAIEPRRHLAQMRRRMGISRQARKDTRNFENAQLLFHEIETFDQWWTAVCEAADMLGLDRIWLHAANRGGQRRILAWASPNGAAGNGTVRMEVPVRDRRFDSTLHGRVEIPVNGSLEAAGRKALLFSRLLDEHGLMSLPRLQTSDNRVEKSYSTSGARLARGA